MNFVNLASAHPDAVAMVTAALENYAHLNTCQAVRWRNTLHQGETTEANVRRAEIHEARAAAVTAMAEQLKPKPDGQVGKPQGENHG